MRCSQVLVTAATTFLLSKSPVLRRLMSSWKGKFLVLWLASRLVMRYWPRADIKGKLFLVTGGAQGIGLEICKQLAKQGANLVIWDISEDAMAAAKQTLTSQFEELKVWTHVVDVSNQDIVYASAKKLEEEAGNLYGLVNNAGVVSGRPFLDIDDHQIIRTMKINTFAHFWTIKAFLPGMLKRNSGNICAISSCAGLFGNPGMTDYCASKFAIVGLMESLRLEIGKTGRHGVTTTTVCPAHVQTDLFTGFKSNPLLPTLTPQYVGRQVVDAIRTGNPVAIMPRGAYLGLVVKSLFPARWDDKIKELAGITGSMDHFNGRDVSVNSH